jgi:hypothetical protein
MPKSIEELDDELCRYCHCTEYGSNMEAPKIKGTPSGYSSCEGAYCNDAYDYYLEHQEEEEEK